MIDREIILEKLDRLGRYLTELDSLRAIDRISFIGDSRNVAASESFLRRALECVFDIGRHILARTGGAELAGEYKSIARGLGERQIIPADLVAELIQMAGYRNRLVHMYHMVTDEELWDIIQRDLDSFRRYLVAIGCYLSGGHRQA